MSFKFTPKSVGYSPSNREILVVGENEQGEITNVTIRDNTDLAGQVASTPRTISNPAFEALQEQAFAAAIAQAAAQPVDPAQPTE